MDNISAKQKRDLIQAFYNYVYEEHDCVLREEQIDLFLISTGDIQEQEEDQGELEVALAKFREEKAAKRLSLPFIILSNEQIYFLTFFMPSSPNDLAGILEAWQIKEYGKEVIDIVNQYK